MPIFNNILAGSSGQGDTGYDIEQSLRFENADTASLNRTPSGLGNRRTWTWSGWVKRGVLTDRVDMFGTASTGAAGGAGEEELRICFTDADIIQLGSDTGETMRMDTTPVYRDPSAWYHIVFAMDTTQATDTNRMKLYVNGEQVTDLGTTNYPTQNLDTAVNYTHAHYIGGSGTLSNNFDGYLAEVHFIDGQALTPASFGETSATNQWVPIDAKDDLTYGTNGFYLPFSSTELANSFTDSSSSSHTITANGDVAHSRAQEKIGSSSIYFDGTGDYLSVPDGSDWDFGTDAFTMESWIRVSDFDGGSGSETATVISSGDSSYGDWFLAIWSVGGTNKLGFYGPGGWKTGSTEISADTWYHVAITRSGDTWNLWLNGTAESGNFPLTESGSMSTSTALSIGRRYSSSAWKYLDGYLTEIRISDIARYTGTFTPNSTTAFTADANTLLLIHSDFDGGIGADSSGNTNDFSATNLVATDVVIDAPTNNFATLNPLNVPTSNAPTFSEGNLQSVVSTGWGGSSTIEQSSGKWYAEFLFSASTGASEEQNVGVIYDSAITANANEFPGRYARGYSYYRDGQKINDGNYTSYGDAFTTGDIIGVALNLEDNELKFYKNGTVQNSGTAISITSGQSYGFAVGQTAGSRTSTWIANFGQDSSFIGEKTAQGNGGDGEDFYYTPPSGYLALCSDNLPDPAIALPTDHFNTLIWTGNDSNPRSFTGVGFQPDFVWSKGRSLDYSHSLYDSIRGGGANAELQSNSTAVEGGGNQDQYGYLSSFDSDGFTAASGTSANNYFNNSSYTYVAWNWKAGGTAVSNTDGSLSSSVSANTTAGFSIVSYTGTGSAATVGHGLSQKPDMIILKKRSGVAQWPVGLEQGSMDWTDYIALDKTSNSGDYPYWNDTAPTASVFSIGTDGDVNQSTGTYIAYCFHSVDGYSKVGSYEGNGSADGSFIYLGFKPEFFLIKNIDAVEGWEIWDGTRETYNKLSKKISPNTSDAEYTASTTPYAIDFLSNGVKLRTTYSAVNASNTFLYYAVASSPFKTSNAR